MRSFTAVSMLAALAIGFAIFVPQASAENAVTIAAQPQLSPAVRDVLKLSRAQVGDQTVTAYIANSGLNYNLTARDIVYLKGQGVSDAAITAMLHSRHKPSIPVASVAAPKPKVSVSAPAPATTQHSAQAAPAPAPSRTI